MAPGAPLPPADLEASLPELPNELLLALQQTLDRDALDRFIAGDSKGVQVEDLLNELIPDGEYSAMTLLITMLTSP